MPLSAVPTDGPTIPAGAQKVTTKQMDVSQNTKREDVTDLADEERVYADPCLRDKPRTLATAQCSASGLLKSGTSLAVTPISTTTGWICEKYSKSREVGKYATWSASWSYYPPSGS
jgi:hypothetical protein